MATVEMATELLLTQGNGGEARRRELGTFLRSRRERVRPEDVGLRLTRRRRTPGLRREEVAQLAGVGVTWYTWLEQGRDINPSAQVLDAIARTLQSTGTSARTCSRLPAWRRRPSPTTARSSARPCSR